MTSIPRINQLNSFKHSANPLSTTNDFDGIDYLNKAAKDVTSPGVIAKMPGPYKGVCFVGKGDAIEIVPEELSWFEKLTKQTIPKTRIRIPELHCHLPEPDDYSKCKPTLAHLYPEFIGETVDTTYVPPRAIAWCTYLDRNNFQDPILLAPYSMEQCVEGTAKTTATGASLAGGPASGNTPGTSKGASGQVATVTSVSATTTGTTSQSQVSYGTGDSILTTSFILAHPDHWYPISKPRTINRIVIHMTGGPRIQSSIDWFLLGPKDKICQYSKPGGGTRPGPRGQSSAHYIISNDGARIVQMVRENDIAFHATSVNADSIGIELAANPYKPETITREIYEVGAQLTRDICNRYGIPIDRDHIIGHAQVPQKNQHTDPGPYWDWDLFMDLVNNAVINYEQQSTE